MFTRKKAAFVQGIVCGVTLILLAVLAVFVLTYDKAMINATIDRLNSQPSDEGVNLSGIGPAILLVFLILSTVLLVVPANLLLVSTVGQLVLGRKKDKAFLVFAIIGMVGKILAVIVVGFTVVLLFDRALREGISLAVHIAVLVLTVAGLAWDVVALYKKTGIKGPVSE